MPKLRIHLFGPGDPTLEEARHDMPLYRELTTLKDPMPRLPDESTVLRFRPLLEAHGSNAKMLVAVDAVPEECGLTLGSGPVVDAPRISAPNSTKNRTRKHDPEMRQTKGG